MYIRFTVYAILYVAQIMRHRLIGMLNFHMGQHVWRAYEIISDYVINLFHQTFPLNFRFIIVFPGIKKLNLKMIFISPREMVSLMACKNAAAVRFFNNVMYAIMDSMAIQLIWSLWKNENILFLF